MGRVPKYHGWGTQNIMVRRCNIQWVTVKIPWIRGNVMPLVGGKNTMDRGVSIPWIGGQNTIGKGINIPPIAGSKYHG